MHTNEVSAARPGVVLPAWAWIAAAVAMAVFYAVMMDGGVVSAAIGQSGMFLHELFHDGRHLIGAPCH